jgi:hypothetical protein
MIAASLRVRTLLRERDVPEFIKTLLMSAEKKQTLFGRG